MTFQVTQILAQILDGQGIYQSIDDSMKISITLAWRLALFSARLFRGELDDPEMLARVLDELSDLAWEEAEQTSI